MYVCEKMHSFMKHDETWAVVLDCLNLNSEFETFLLYDFWQLVFTYSLRVFSVFMRPALHKYHYEFFYMKIQSKY